MKRALLLTPIFALCAVLASCGGGEDSTSSFPESQPRVAARVQNQKARAEYEERMQAEAPTREEQEAKDQVQGFYDVLAKDEAKSPNETSVDSKAFCELMSVEAQAQTVEYAKRSSGIAKQWDCENAVELLVLRSKRFGAFKQTRQSEVLGVNAEGDRATATVRFGRGAATSISLVREDGEWKLAASPAKIP